MEGYNYEINAYTASGISSCLSNFMDCKQGNGVFDLIDIIEDAEGDAQKATRMLNNCKHIYGTFAVHRKTTNGFVLCNTDRCGNKSFIKVRRM